MQTINEVNSNPLLSRDFELIQGRQPMINTQAKKYLKHIDDAAAKYKINYNKAREAAKLFKMGDLEGALRKVWGNKLEVETVNAEENGHTTTTTYTIDCYGTFTDKITRKGPDFYSRSITATYNDNPNPGFALSSVFYVDVKRNGNNFEGQIERATLDAFRSVPCALIYNILFTCWDSTNISTICSPLYIKLRKKLG